MQKLKGFTELCMISWLKGWIADNQQTWDLFLNQALAAIRFNVSESSKFSPFFLLYNRDVVLPEDNILKPRRRYVGAEMHQIALQEQHKSFVAVRNHLRKQRKGKQNMQTEALKQLSLRSGILCIRKIIKGKASLT